MNINSSVYILVGNSHEILGSRRGNDNRASCLAAFGMRTGDLPLQSISFLKHIINLILASMSEWL